MRRAGVGVVVAVVAGAHASSCGGDRSCCYHWIDFAPLQTSFQVQTSHEDGQVEMIQGRSAEISEVGIRFHLETPHPLPPQSAVQLTLASWGLSVTGRVVTAELAAASAFLEVRFDSLTLEQERCLIEHLFCRPGQWSVRQSPGEWQSLQLLCCALWPGGRVNQRGQLDKRRQAWPMPRQSINN